MTISIAHQASVSLLVSRLNREEFLKTFGNKAVEMEGMKDFQLPNQEKDAIAFLSYLDSKGYQEKIADGLDIFALIVLVYVRNNYF